MELCCCVSVDLYVEMPLSVLKDKRNDTSATSNDQATLKGAKHYLIFQHFSKQIFNACFIVT